MVQREGGRFNPNETTTTATTAVASLRCVSQSLSPNSPLTSQSQGGGATTGGGRGQSSSGQRPTTRGAAGVVVTLVPRAG